MTYTPTDADVERAAGWIGKLGEDCRDQARAVLIDHHAELERQGWQMVRWEPIEAAPKDAPILVCRAGYWPVASQWSWVGGGWRNGFDRDIDDGDHLTHWMPLPKPPGGDK